MRSNDQTMQEGRKFHKCIFRYFEQCKSENFFRLWWETHLKINPYQSLELWEDLSLRLTVKRCQSSNQVQFPS